jgi:regulatory protein
MIVSSLKKKNNSVVVCFQDGSEIVIDYNVVVKLGVRINDQLSEDKIKLLLNRSEISKIKNYAFRFLGFRNHSSQELKLKLLKKKFSPELIAEVLNELTEKNILDDTQYAKQYLEEKLRKGKTGPNKIKSDLLRKGIKREVVDKLCLSVYADSSFQTALELAGRKILTIKEKDKRKVKQKIYFYLHNKGFESDIILAVLKKIFIDND